MINIIEPVCLEGHNFNIRYKCRKYHSGTICRGVINSFISIIISGWTMLNIENISIENIWITSNITMMSLIIIYGKIVIDATLLDTYNTLREDINP